MKRRAALYIFAAIIPAVCFAQSDKTESITITTYYPSPSGVYKTIRLYPSLEPTSPQARQPGTMFFCATDNTTYIFNNTAFVPLGSGGSGGSGSAGLKVDSGHHVYPNTCNPGTFTLIVAPPEHDAPWDTSDYEICSQPWSILVDFNHAFSKPPRVFVTLDRGAGREGHELANYTCGRHGTDTYFANATNITTTNFRLWASGSSPKWNDCESYYPDVETIVRSFIKAEASWMAVGE